MTHPILRHQVPTGVAAQTVAVRSPRFPDDDPAAPVYTVKVPTRRDRIEWQADITAAGLRHPSDADLLDVLRTDLRAHVQQADALLEIVDAYEAAIARAVQEAAEAAEGDAPPAVDPDLVRQYVTIEEDVRRNCEPFRLLEADRRRFHALLPYLTVARFLMGWQNGPGEFVRAGGLVPDSTVDLIDDADLRAVHATVIDLMGVGRAAVKNSGSPSGSPSGPSSSTAGAKPRTGRGGKSTATATT